MVDANEQYAYFSVVDGFDPFEVTLRTGIQPTESWKRGDICPRTLRERKYSRWSLYSRLSRDRNLEDHVTDVLNQLDANQQAFRALSLDYGGCMKLVGYFRQEYPGLQFCRDTIERLAQYALEVDFDFYYLYSHRREDT